MTIRKTVKNWAEMSLNVVDFKIFRFQLELCFAASFFFLFYLNTVLVNYSPEYCYPGCQIGHEANAVSFDQAARLQIITMPVCAALVNAL